MTFDQILSAVYAMPRAERDRLYHAIVFIDGWCKADECDNVPKQHGKKLSNVGKKYTQSEVAIIQQAINRVESLSVTNDERRAAYTAIARQLGRKYKDIYNKAYKMTHGGSVSK